MARSQICGYLLLFLLLSSVSSVTAEQIPEDFYTTKLYPNKISNSELTVSADTFTFTPVSIINLAGFIQPPNPGQQIFITVLNPIGNIVVEVSPVTGNQGFFEAQLDLPDDIQTGIYKIETRTVQNGTPLSLMVSYQSSVSKAEVVIPNSAYLQNSNVTFTPELVQTMTDRSIIWKNEDDATHTVVSGYFGFDGKMYADGVFDSGVFGPKKSFEITLEEGEYHYFCKLHPWLTGSIVVEKSNQPVIPKITAEENLIAGANLIKLNFTVPQQLLESGHILPFWIGFSMYLNVHLVSPTGEQSGVPDFQIFSDQSTSTNIKNGIMYFPLYLQGNENKKYNLYAQYYGAGFKPLSDPIYVGQLNVLDKKFDYVGTTTNTLLQSEIVKGKIVEETIPLNNVEQITFWKTNLCNGCNGNLELSPDKKEGKNSVRLSVTGMQNSSGIKTKSGFDFEAVDITKLDSISLWIKTGGNLEKTSNMVLTDSAGNTHNLQQFDSKTFQEWKKVTIPLKNLVGGFDPRSVSGFYVVSPNGTDFASKQIDVYIDDVRWSKTMVVLENPELAPKVFLYVNPNKFKYFRGDVAFISGGVQNRESNLPVTIKITNPVGNIVTINQITPNRVNGFSFEVPIEGNQFLKDGEYIISAQYGVNNYQYQNFFVVANLESPPEVTLPEIVRLFVESELKIFNENTSTFLTNYKALQTVQDNYADKVLNIKGQYVTTFAFQDRYGREDSNNDLNVFFQVSHTDTTINSVRGVELGGDKIMANIANGQKVELSRSAEVNMPEGSIVAVTQKTSEKFAGVESVTTPSVVLEFLNTNLEILNAVTGEKLSHYYLIQTVEDKFAQKQLGITGQFVTTLAFQDRYGRPDSNNDLNVFFQVSHTDNKINSLRAIQMGGDDIKVIVNGVDGGSLVKMIEVPK